MKNLDDLFDFILEHDKTIVYGNLGRQYTVLFDYLMHQFPTFDIVVFSPYYEFPATQNIHTKEEAIRKCDMLLYIEPAPRTPIRCPDNVGRTVVFASHMLVNCYEESPVFVSYFHSPHHDLAEEIRRTRELNARRDSSIRTERADVMKSQIDFGNVKTLGTPSSDIALGRDILSEKTYVVVDGTQARSPIALYLQLWDCFDYLKANLSSVERWLICFPERAMKSHEQLVQTCVDSLFCNKKLKNGNVLEVHELLSIFPFYASAVIDKESAVQEHTFCRKRYIAPAFLDEAMKSCIVYNLTPINENLYFVE